MTTITKNKSLSNMRKLFDPVSSRKIVKACFVLPSMEQMFAHGLFEIENVLIFQFQQVI